MRRIGIRREDKDLWEARVPLVPEDVAGLTSSSAAEIVVQPSPRRVFTEDEYVCAGARVDEDLGACDIVLAVKEILVSSSGPARPTRSSRTPSKDSPTTWTCSGA